MDQVSSNVNNTCVDDDTTTLIEFYERNLQFFEKCPVHSLSSTVLKKVAVKIHSTLYFDSDWQEYATEMGITDNLHLAIIQESSKVAKELALYITMKTALQRINGNLANIIKCLLSTKRYDVLQYLKPFILEILRKITDTEVKRYVNTEDEQSCLSNLDSYFTSETTEETGTETIFSANSINSVNSKNYCKVESNPTLQTEHITIDFDVFQKTSEQRNPLIEMKLLPSDQHQVSSEGNSLSVSKSLPSAPLGERLSVFIQHTEYDTEMARQLAIKLREEGIAVTTLSDMDKLILMDSTGALSTVFGEVDFVVPIVSKQFLEQIHPQIYDKYLESADAKNNRILYQLIMTEYHNNGCINIRVRPVLVPDMNRRLLNSNIILSYAFRLWNEVPKLIKILRETKELIPHNPFN